MPPIGNKIKLQENRSLLENPRVKAMLNTIAYAEGADYNTRVGGGTFGDLSKKPGKKNVHKIYRKLQYSGRSLPIFK